MILVSQGTTTTQFTYNGDGDRLAQTITSITTDYALDPAGLAQVLIETTGGQSTSYLPGLAQYDTAWSYYLPDRLGSIRHLVDPNAALLLAQSYDPFGNVLEQVGSGQSRFGYTGEQTDPTGLVFLRARYYHPAVGRFITADSIIPNPFRSQGWNRYAYVGNNPINYVDPSGYCLEPVSGTICVIGGIAVTAEFLMATAVTFGIIGTAVGSKVFLDQHQTAINTAVDAAMDPFRLPSEGFNLLDEDIINPCYQPGSNVGQPDPWQLPPFSLTPLPYFGPVTPGIPIVVDPPIILTIKRSQHEESRHQQGDRPTSYAHQDQQNPSEVYTDNETGNTIYVGPKGRTHVFLPDGTHHTSFVSSRQTRIMKVIRGKWTRL